MTTTFLRNVPQFFSQCGSRLSRASPSLWWVPIRPWLSTLTGSRSTGFRKGEGGDASRSETKNPTLYKNSIGRQIISVIFLQKISVF